MPSFYGPVDLIKNELRNAVVQNLGAAPSSPLKGQIYMDSTANILYWYNGTAWVSASGATPAATVTTQAIGDAPVVGTLITFAREDHKHGEPGFGVPLSPNPGDVAGQGGATTVARSDHAHGLQPWASTVTAQTTYGLASNQGAANIFCRSDHMHGTPTHLAADHSTIPLNTLGAPTNDLSINSHKLTNVLDPTNPQDGATKNYVDGMAAGLSWKAPVRVATTLNITLSGTQTIDGVAVVVGDRVLVKNQVSNPANGIYVVAAGAWARSNDAATGPELVNASVFTEMGTSQADTSWVCNADPPITVGTTGLGWVQFAGPGTYNAGSGLTLAGTTFAVGPGTGILSTPGVTAVDTSVIATVASVTAATAGMVKKYATTLAGTASPETVTHNLNTRDVQVTVLNGASPYGAVEVDWQATTVNTVTINYNPALGAGYRVVVTG